MNALQNDNEYQPLHIEVPIDATAQQIALITNIRVLEQQILKRRTWSMRQIVAFLEGARDAALKGKDVAIAEDLFEQAHHLFQEDTQIRNRNWYVISMLAGVAGVAMLATLLVYLASIFSNLADPETIISLFTFAAMGSATSILTRLSSLDLRKEMSQKFVVYSAIARPFVAISFASIVYVILKYKVIAIQLGNTNSEEAVWWIAAFLCGFSERFASDMLNRVFDSTPNSAKS